MASYQVTYILYPTILWMMVFHMPDHLVVPALPTHPKAPLGTGFY